MSDVTPQTSPEILEDVSADRSADSDAGVGESTSPEADLETGGRQREDRSGTSRSYLRAGGGVQDPVCQRAGDIGRAV